MPKIHPTARPIRSVRPLPLLLAALAAAWPAGCADADETTIQDLAFRAQHAYRQGDHDRALAIADEIVAHHPDETRAYVFRGSLRFRCGRFEASVEDFDRAAQLDPDIEPYLWQRGISHYYAGQYRNGVQQFELHRKVNPDDVENSVWHFLNFAELKGVEAARRAFLPVDNDPREPMMKIHALFAGHAEPEDVLAAARAGRGPDADAARPHRLFYAHLYLGLYHQAMGHQDKAAEHIRIAATEHTSDHYMGDVARVHHRLLQADDDAPKPPNDSTDTSK